MVDNSVEAWIGVAKRRGSGNAWNVVHQGPWRINRSTLVGGGRGSIKWLSCWQYLLPLGMSQPRVYKHRRSEMEPREHIFQGLLGLGNMQWSSDVPRHRSQKWCHKMGCHQADKRRFLKRISASYCYQIQRKTGIRWPRPLMEKSFILSSERLVKINWDSAEVVGTWQRWSRSL